MTTISYKNNPRFEKDFKRLSKKYRSLEDDIEVVKKNAIELYHLHNIDNNSVELVPNFDGKVLQIFKVKKFACKSLKGKGVRSGIRLTYGFFIMTQTVEFLEIYYKDRESEDMDYGFTKEYFSFHEPLIHFPISKV